MRGTEDNKEEMKPSLEMKVKEEIRC